MFDYCLLNSKQAQGSCPSDLANRLAVAPPPRISKIKTHFEFGLGPRSELQIGEESIASAVWKILDSSQLLFYNFEFHVSYTEKQAPIGWVYADTSLWLKGKATHRFEDNQQDRYQEVDLRQIGMKPVSMLHSYVTPEI